MYASFLAPYYLVKAKISPAQEDNRKRSCMQDMNCKGSNTAKEMHEVSERVYTEIITTLIQQNRQPQPHNEYDMSLHNFWYHMLFIGAHIPELMLTWHVFAS